MFSPSLIFYRSVRICYKEIVIIISEYKINIIYNETILYFYCLDSEKEIPLI